MHDTEQAKQLEVNEYWTEFDENDAAIKVESKLTTNLETSVQHKYMDQKAD